MKLFTVERISRMSALRRHNFQRRLMERVEDAEHASELLQAGFGLTLHRRVQRALAVLGRFLLISEQHPTQS